MPSKSAQIHQWLVICALLAALSPAQGQPSYADSLAKALGRHGPNSERVAVLNELGWEWTFEGRSEEARRCFEEAAGLARRLGDRQGEAQAHNNWGTLESVYGNYAAAREHYDTALRLRRQIGDAEKIASTLNNIGNLLESLGDYDGAKAHVAEALQIREEQADTLGMAKAYANLGVIAEAQGDYVVAQDYYLKGLDMAERLGGAALIADFSENVGNVQYELERYDKAEQFYQRSLDIRQQLGLQADLAQSYNSFGLLRSGRKDYERAIADFGQALRIWRELGDELSAASALTNIGHAYKKKDRFAEALRYFDEALGIYRSYEDRQGEMQIYANLGDVRRGQKRYAEALVLTQKCLDMARELGDEKYEENSYQDLAKTYERMGDFEQAYAHFKAYAELRQSRLNEKRNEQFARMEVLFDTNQKEREIERQKNEIALQQARIDKARTLRNALIGGAAALLLIALLLYNRYAIKTQANKALAEKNQAIEAERAKSERLLLNILPKRTAEELKSEGRARARAYDEVSILFTDFKAFTQVAERMSADELVALLDECFRAFDEIVARYGLEKIKTIGDAYMCAGGLPDPLPDHALRMVNAALDIRDYMLARHAAQRAEGKAFFEIRLGIHIGPVVAGVVGSHKFAYDIWGDAVNLAARMESSGQVGKVNISQAVYERVGHAFACEARGRVAAKNKGEIEMYFAERRADQA